MFELLMARGIIIPPFELLPHTGFRYTNDYVKGLFVLDWSWSDMGNLFKFTNRNELKEDGTRVWRSTTPFDQFSLPPTPHLVLPPGATEFTDPDAPRGSEYYYLLEVFKGSGNSEFTGPLKATALGINTGPGPQELIAGDQLSGLYGTVEAVDFITGDDLANSIGLTTGTAQNSTVPWLKFILEGKTLFVPERTFRHSISWNNIHARGAVYGTATVQIQGDTYKVRLLKGAATDPISGGSNQSDPEQSWGSEWNRLFYPLVPNPTRKPGSGISGEGIRYGAFANYTETQLNVGSSGGNGRYTWCQETSGSNRVNRGYGDLSRFRLNGSSDTTVSYGWRPVLELVV